jgi:hypothetical protein
LAFDLEILIERFSQQFGSLAYVSAMPFIYNIQTRYSFILAVSGRMARIGLLRSGEESGNPAEKTTAGATSDPRLLI